MKNSGFVFGAFILLLSATLPLHAQNGCVNSPENPTVVLGLVGSAGALLSTVRARRRSQRKAASHARSRHNEKLGTLVSTFRFEEMAPAVSASLLGSTNGVTRRLCRPLLESDCRWLGQQGDRT